MCIIFEKIFVEIPDPACILMESKNLRDGIPYPEKKKAKLEIMHAWLFINHKRSPAF